MDPERFLDHPPSPAVLRALRADTAMNPPAGAEDAVWSRVTAVIAAGGAAIAASTTLGAATQGALGSASASVAKAVPLSFVALSKLFGMSFGVGLIVSGAGALVLHSADFGANDRASVNVAPPSGHERGGHDLAAGHVAKHDLAAGNVPRDVATDAAATRDVPGSAAPSRTTQASGTEPALHGTAPAAHASASPRDVSSAAPTSPAAAPSEESRIVLAARDALRAGEPRRALAELERAELAGLPGLAQERLALEIDAWLAAGMLDIAKERAAVFLQRYPDSPHAARFRSLR